jgi:hypothetical protein
MHNNKAQRPGTRVADESTTRSTELEKKIVADVVVVTLVVASRNARWTVVAWQT